MKCHKEDAPLLGLMGQSMRLIGKKAQELYAEYDLNRAQSGILFALHQEDSIFQNIRYPFVFECFRIPCKFYLFKSLLPCYQ